MYEILSVKYLLRFFAKFNTRDTYTGDENLPYIRHMGDHLCHMVTFYLPYIVIW